MSFAENLQTIRKQHNLTQDDLAAKLDVTRQAVSKWESGNGYPEMEKIMLLCDMFECSMDALLKGDIATDERKTKEQYEKLFNARSIFFALGVVFILLGVTLFLAFLSLAPEDTPEQEKFTLIGIAVLLCFVAVSVAIFIIYGLKTDEFKRKHPVIENLYTEDEISAYNKKFPIYIAAGVGLIIFGVIAMFLIFALSPTLTQTTAPVAILMAFITVGVFALVYAGMQKSKYELSDYNFEKTSPLSEKISGVIMLSATAIFLLLGFVFSAWEWSWAVFPIGGIACAIVDTILKKNN